MTNPPAFQLYAADFLIDTLDWTPAQVGAYCRLLFTEWVNGPLPNNMSELARIAGVPDVRTMYKMWHAKLGKKFIENGGNFLINKRLEQTRVEQEEYRKKQSEAGLKGVKAKKKAGIYPFNKESDPSSDPSSQNQALQSSSSIKNLDTKVSKKEKVELPEWLNPELWREFLKHRTKLKKPMTPYAQRKMIAKLTWHKERGFNPVHMLNESIVKGWQDVFEPKG